MRVRNAAATLGIFTSLTKANIPKFFEQGDSWHPNLTTASSPFATNFTTLELGAFPGYSVRVRKSSFCDLTVGAYTGYIDIEARHLFFYFFESRNDPDKDDIVFWTNGCSGASMGLFMELGPCRVTSPEDGPIMHPYSWNEYANVIFIDQPVGTGFSYAEFGEYVTTTEEAAKDVAAFLAIFFTHFSRFEGRALHMAGESYGGRYIPVFASEIYENNARLIQAGLTPINLTSIMIGNGCTDMLEMYPSYYEMQCQNKTFKPITDIQRCVEMKRALPRCVQRLKHSCYDTRDSIDCDAAATYCEHLLMDPFRYNGRNPYDLSKQCEGPYVETLCYPVTKNITKYLQRPDVRKLIGVDPSLPANLSGCSWEVMNNFRTTLDHMNPTQYYLSALLDRGIRVLLYVGANDWMCNWVANERMSLDLEWHGQETFAQRPLEPWKVGDESVGSVRSAGLLTFVTIAGAGHMVPYDKPEVSLELLRRWLAKKIA